VRRAARVDANHGDIRECLRKLGWLILDLSRVGQGCPDLLGWRAGYGFALFELKMPRGKVTMDQLKFVAKGWPVVILRSVDDAVVFTKHGRDRFHLV